MAAVTWSNLKPLHRLERIGRLIACWSRLAGFYGVEGENGLAGLAALVALPAAFVASLASSLPLAVPVALATINLSIAGERRNAPNRAGIAELSLAILLGLVAIFFAVLAVNRAAMAAPLAGAVISLAFASLPSILRLLMTALPEDSTVLSRDVAGLDRLTPDERLLVVEQGGRVAALSRAAMRQFAQSGLKPGADLIHLIDCLDRPLLLNALDRASGQEQIISLRLNADHCQSDHAATRIDLSLVAVDARNIIVRLQDPPPGALDIEQPDCSIHPAARQTGCGIGEGACDLEDTVRFAIRLLAGDADGRGVRVSMQERPDRDAKPALPVKCSARAARQIALNVIGNAIKFSHAGGLVTIQTDSDDESGLLCVRDEGIGIAERDRDALFCPHERGSGSGRPGWGLGLAIVGDLVAGCEGKITVKSSAGKGTIVSVRIPTAGKDHEAGRIDPPTLSNQSREIARAA
jgi:signal transduction histidine kinase